MLHGYVKKRKFNMITKVKLMNGKQIVFAKRQYFRQ